MKIRFWANIKDGIYRPQPHWFTITIDDDDGNDHYSDREIEEIVHEEIVNNRLEWDWERVED